MRVSHLGGKHFQAKSFTLRCGISDKPRASEFTLIKKKRRFDPQMDEYYNVN